jgi:hypothetical protein
MPAASPAIANYPRLPVHVVSFRDASRSARASPRSSAGAHATEGRVNDQRLDRQPAPAALFAARAALAFANDARRRSSTSGSVTLRRGLGAAAGSAARPRPSPAPVAGEGLADAPLEAGERPAGLAQPAVGALRLRSGKRALEVAVLGDEAVDLVGQLGQQLLAALARPAGAGGRGAAAADLDQRRRRLRCARRPSSALPRAVPQRRGRSGGLLRLFSLAVAQTAGMGGTGGRPVAGWGLVAGQRECRAVLAGQARTAPVRYIQPVAIYLQ